jgi:hypothetical protein
MDYKQNYFTEYCRVKSMVLSEDWKTVNVDLLSYMKDQARLDNIELKYKQCNEFMVSISPTNTPQCIDVYRVNNCAGQSKHIDLVLDDLNKFIDKHTDNIKLLQDQYKTTLILHFSIHKDYISLMIAFYTHYGIYEDLIITNFINNVLRLNDVKFDGIKVYTSVVTTCDNTNQGCTIHARGSRINQFSTNLGVIDQSIENKENHRRRQNRSPLFFTDKLKQDYQMYVNKYIKQYTKDILKCLVIDMRTAHPEDPLPPREFCRGSNDAIYTEADIESILKRLDYLESINPTYLLETSTNLVRECRETKLSVERRKIEIQREIEHDRKAIEVLQTNITTMRRLKISGLDNVEEQLNMNIDTLTIDIKYKTSKLSTLDKLLA